MTQEKSLGKQEIIDVAEHLAKLEAGYLPSEIFYQIARLSVCPVVELVPIRKNKNIIEVLLFERPESDPYWGGMLHSPGTVVRATDIKGTDDAAFQSAFLRLLTDEIYGVEVIGKPEYVEVELRTERRGTALAHIYSIEVGKNGSTGTFYDVNNLPSNIVDSQINFILHAVDKFKLTM